MPIGQIVSSLEPQGVETLGDIGLGYGSEWHLMRFLGRHRKHLTVQLLKSINLGTHIDWLDFDFNAKSKYYDVELKGLRFLKGSAYDKIHRSWEGFWPQSGNPPNWDAVGWLGNNRYPDNPSELLLVEAKAHTGELKRSCSATDRTSIIRIQTAMDQVKAGLGISTSNDWLKDYYQFANRIAVLWFLIKNGLPARLIYIYFIGDSHQVANCPTSQQEWENALLSQDQHLGLVSGHKLDMYIHKIFLDVKGT